MVEEVRGLAKERRMFERIKAGFPVDILVTGGAEEIKAESLEVSAGGMSVVSRRKADVGKDLKLWLNIQDKRKPFYTQGKVRWVNSSDGNRFRFGIEFDKPEFMGISRVLY